MHGKGTAHMGCHKYAILENFIPQDQPAHQAEAARQIDGAHAGSGADAQKNPLLTPLFSSIIGKTIAPPPVLRIAEKCCGSRDVGTSVRRSLRSFFGQKLLRIAGRIAEKCCGSQKNVVGAPSDGDYSDARAPSCDGGENYGSFWADVYQPLLQRAQDNVLGYRAGALGIGLPPSTHAIILDHARKWHWVWRVARETAARRCSHLRTLQAQLQSASNTKFQHLVSLWKGGGDSVHPSAPAAAPHETEDSATSIPGGESSVGILQLVTGHFSDRPGSTFCPGSDASSAVGISHGPSPAPDPEPATLGINLRWSVPAAPAVISPHSSAPRGPANGHVSTTPEPSGEAGCSPTTQGGDLEPGDDSVDTDAELSSTCPDTSTTCPEDPTSSPGPGRNSPAIPIAVDDKYHSETQMVQVVAGFVSACCFILLCAFGLFLLCRWWHSS